MSNNISNSPFNFIANNRRTIAQISKSFKGLAKNIFNFGYDYVEKYENVFTGEVADETSKSLSYIHSLGVAMREGQPKRTFDKKM